MDALIAAAARALATGDILGALKRVALRDDAPALALRGIAMAQLGDFVRAKTLLKSAARAFGPREAVSRARCLVAEAEIAFVSRDLGWPEAALAAARVTLETHGDRINATHALHLEARRLLLLGRLDAAEQKLGARPVVPMPPTVQTAHELILAGIALRRLQAGPARAALARADMAARVAGIPALLAEVEAAYATLNAPTARLFADGTERLVHIEEVEAVLASDALIIDASRNLVRSGGTMVPLASRPVLFALLRALAESWPGDTSRDELLIRAFGARHVDESHRARLRVEIGRLRAELKPLAGVNATTRGFVLKPRTRQVLILAPPTEGRHAAVLAVLADGEAWSSSALAIALGSSPRTVQRALDELATSGKAQSFGRGRAIRWIASSVPGFPTVLLLPGPPPGG